MGTNYPFPLQTENPDAPHVGLLFKQVQTLYVTRWKEWFGITAPTSVVAAFVLLITDRQVQQIVRSGPRDPFQTHFSEMVAVLLFRFGGLFLSWLLGCFALSAIATVVCNLYGNDEEAWLRDSHQRAREHFGALITLALLIFIAFLIGTAAVGVVISAIIKLVGWAWFARFNLAVSLLGTVIVAAIVSWLGMAIPLVLRGDVGVWTALGKN